MFRLHLKYQLVAIALMVLIFSNCDTHIKKVAEKQNILFIAVDDMNDWAGFLSGHTGMKIHTPNIDRLASSSMIFTNAHTPAPVCAPARTSHSYRSSSCPLGA